MKTILAVAGLLAITGASAEAQYYGSNNNRNSSSYGGFGTGSNPSSTYVAPSVNRNGDFTGGHFRTTPNNTQSDNYGTRGNVNPYTGNVGTRSPNRW